MLNTIGDWYRLVSPFPDDDRLRKRRASAGSLATSLAAAKVDEILDFVGLAIEAVDAGRNPDNPALAVVLHSVLEDEPSLDRKIAAESLDLRICAAIALGEFMTNAGNVGTVRRRSSAALAAAAVASALRHRQATTGDYAEERAVALLNVAETILEGIDRHRRERKDTAVARFNKLAEAGDANVPALVKTLVAGLHDEMLKDREELQALWWVFGGHSHSARRPFKELDGGTAAVLAAIELAGIVRPPATLGLSALASRAARAARNGEVQVPLRELLESVSADAWTALRPKGGDMERVRKNPSLFPITAIACQFRTGRSLDESIRASGNFAGDTALAPVDLAAQVFTEWSLIVAAREA